MTVTLTSAETQRILGFVDQVARGILVPTEYRVDPEIDTVDGLGGLVENRWVVRLCARTHDGRDASTLVGWRLAHMLALRLAEDAWGQVRAVQGRSVT